jgi:hypothetical protein
LRSKFATRNALPGGVQRLALRCVLVVVMLSFAVGTGVGRTSAPGARAAVPSTPEGSAFTAAGNAPRFGRFVDVAPVKGHVGVAVPGGRSTPLRGLRRVPVRSVLDVSGGTAAVIVAGPRGSRTYRADFSGGKLRLLQRRSLRGVTELRVVGLRLGCK